MDEYLDIVDANGKPTGKTALKSDVHTKGYYHHTVHVWFYTSEGEILLSQRSAKKIICPLLWDVSVAGHIDAGETIKQAAIRETKEEIGITITEKSLHKICVSECFQTYENGIVDNEFHNTFITELKVPLSKLVAQPEEVEALKLIPFDAFKTLIATINTNNNHLVASNKTYYEFVLNSILKHIKIGSNL